MRPKAVVLDLDGTLLNSKKQISARNLRALNMLREEGIELIFATARPPRFVSFGGIDLAQYGTVVYYNGAMFHCRSTEQTVHFDIPQPLLADMVAYCLSLDPDANLSIEVMDRWYSMKPLDYTEMMRVAINPEVINLDRLTSFDCTKLLLTHFDYAEQLIASYGDRANILVTDNGELIQVMSSKAAKENALAYLLKQLQIELQDTLCFGDDYNDLGMFKACGHSVAMGNAVGALKEMATEITATHDEDGVALVLEKYMLSEREGI